MISAHTRKIPSLVITLVLALALMAPALPAHAAGAQTFHFSFKGQFAEALFSSFDETGCIETTVFVAAQEGRVKQDGKPEAESIAIVAISQFNICTGELLLDAFGFTTPTPDEFVIDKKLNQATLTTTMVVEDFLTGMTFPVDVNVTWTGVGETTTVKDHFQIKEPGFKVNSRFMGIIRQAQASGTVMGIDFTPESVIFADMGNVKVGEVVIIH